MCGKWLEYLWKGINMQEIDYMCGKLLKYVGND